MEVILLEKIRNLGNTGEIVNVKDGYGRNFLLKTGKALRADKKNIEFVKRKKDEINKKNVEQKKYANKIFEKIRGIKLSFKKETKESSDNLTKYSDKDTAKDLTPEEFEDFILKSGAKGSFMIYRSKKKDDELGIDKL